MYRTCIAAAVLLAGVGPSAFAQTRECTAPGPDCAVVGEWDLSVAFGAGARTNPIHGKSDIPLFVLPQFSYYGKRFFLDNLELGFTLHETRASTINLIATPGYDRVFFFSGDLQNIFVSGAGSVFVGARPEDGETDAEGLQEFSIGSRHTTYLAGPEWLFNVGRVTGQLDALREVTGEHEGYEVRGAIATPLLQSTSSLVLSAGWTWKSSQLVRYYYGVDGFYEPGAAFNPFLKLGFTRPIAERWAFSAFVHYEHLDEDIAASPLVADDYVLTAFAGVVYKVF